MLVFFADMIDNVGMLVRNGAPVAFKTNIHQCPGWARNSKKIASGN